MKPIFAPGSSIAEAHDISTPAGRRLRFNERLDQLMKPKAQGGPGLTIDQAVHELRTSQNPEDQNLLEAMGEAPSAFRTEKLKQEKWQSDMMKLADANAKAAEPSKEIKAALARNARSLAFNSRLDQLMRPNRDGQSLSLDQAINSMRGNAKDAALLHAMQQPISA